MRKKIPQLEDVVSGQGRGGVGDVAEAGKVKVLQIELKKDGGDGWNERKASDSLANQFLDDCVGVGEGTFQNDRGTDLERHQNLIEPIIEGERENIENDVVGGVFEIGGDGSRRRNDV